MTASSPIEFTKRLSNGHLQRCGNEVELVNPDTGDTLPVDSVTGSLVVLSAAEHASINGNAICRWISNITPGAAQTVLTNGPAGDDPGIYYNVQPDEHIMITQACIELLTLTDDVIFELGYTDAINGGGTFTPITPPRILHTGAARVSFDGLSFDFSPCWRVTYASGARSITYRVNCNDAVAAITPAWHGWRILI